MYVHTITCLVALFGLALSHPTLESRTTAWPQCQNTLSCTFWDIESASMQSRLKYMQDMQSSHFESLNASTRFRAIEGVIKFFISENLGTQGSWVSHVDAGIIEGIQSGAATALGLPVARSAAPADGNPGIAFWPDYFTSMSRPGGFSTRQSHDYAWGFAEKKSTEWAKDSVADVVAKPHATKKELKWFEFTKLFRWIMRNEKKTVISLQAYFLLRPSTWPLVPLADNLVYWLTDTTQVEPALCGCRAAWAAVDPLPRDLEDLILPIHVSNTVIDFFQAVFTCGGALITGS